MRFGISLRTRVILAFALLGMLVSLGLAGPFYLLAIDMQDQLIADTLSVELAGYIARYKADPETPPPASTARATLRTYVIPSRENDVPEVLRKLGSGLHRVRLEGRRYLTRVEVSDGRHFILLYDNQQIRHRESRFKLFLGLGALAITMLFAVFGYWLAGRIVSPVVKLAARIAVLHPEDHGAPLAGDFPHGEVGVLASSFDSYRQRLTAFIEREQAFTADVSHELRTSLTVIEGASEVLLSDPALDQARHLRVERIARSARQMSELVSALRLLAREEKKDTSESDCEVGQVLQQVLEAHQHMLRHKPVKIELTIQTQTILPVECTLLRVVLANLIQNALRYTERGHVVICLDEKGVSVRDTGIGIPKHRIQRVFDRFHTGLTGGEGIGLSLVKRICQRYGWNIHIDSHAGQGTLIHLSFRPSPAAGRSDPPGNRGTKGEG